MKRREAKGERGRHGEYLSTNIGLASRRQHSAEDAPLIDLHKIAVLWLRLPALRADKSDGRAAKRREEKREREGRVRSLPI